MTQPSFRLPLLLCALAFCLGGCGGGASKINGKVVRGDLSFIILVDANDPRLKGEGLPGAHVAIRSVASRGGGLLADGTSDKSGNVTLSVRDAGALLRPAEFSAELEGYQRTTAEMSIPPVDKRILVLLKPGAPGPGK